MRDLAMILNRKRERRGSIDFDLPEPVIEFDENGLMQGITRSERNIAHRLIEEFMLAANECVASYLERNRSRRSTAFTRSPIRNAYSTSKPWPRAFGYSLGVGALPVKRMQMQCRSTLSGSGTGRQRHARSKFPKMCTSRRACTRS